jgi:hypothetical protein
MAQVLAPNYAQLALLLNGDGDGINASSPIVDSGPNAVPLIRTGNPVISTNQSKFGGASIAFPGSSYLTTAPMPSLAFGERDYTIAGWFNCTNNTVENPFFTITSNGVHRLRIWFDAAARVCGQLYGSSAAVGNYSVVGPGSWHYVAITRSYPFTYVLVDGTYAFYLYETENHIGTDATIQLGRDPSTGSVLTGYIDEFYVLPGVYTWAGGPTDCWRAPRVAGVVRDDAGALASRVVRAYNRQNGALVGSAVSNATTGAYSITCRSLDEVQVVALDDDAGTLHNDLIDRVIPG